MCGPAERGTAGCSTVAQCRGVLRAPTAEQALAKERLALEEELAARKDELQESAAAQVR